jgi:hypothetical protein
MGGFDSKGLFVNNDTLIEVGKGMAGKDKDAGTLRYRKDVNGDTVDLVGAGATSKDRKLFLKDDVNINQKLNVGDSLQVKNYISMNGMIQLGSWSIFEDTAGQLRFSKNPNKLTRDQLKSGMAENDGIALTGDGKIWSTQKQADVVPGWLNDKIKNTAQTTKIGDWELTQGLNNELLFTNSKTKQSVVMLADGTVAKKYVAGTFQNDTRNLTNVPHKEWGGEWKKHLEGNTIKYVSHTSHYWRVVSGGYEYLGTTN